MQLDIPDIQTASIHRAQILTEFHQLLALVFFLLVLSSFSFSWVVGPKKFAVVFEIANLSESEFAAESVELCLR